MGKLGTFGQNLEGKAWPLYMRIGGVTWQVLTRLTCKYIWFYPQLAELKIISRLGKEGGGGGGTSEQEVLELLTSQWKIVIFYTYIWTERLRIFIITALILSEFSYGKAQIAFCSKLLSNSWFHGCCIFPHNLKQRQKVVENNSAKNKTLKYWFAAYEDKAESRRKLQYIK